MKAFIFLTLTITLTLATTITNTPDNTNIDLAHINTTPLGFTTTQFIDLNALVKAGTYYNILSKPDDFDRLCYCTQAIYKWLEQDKRLSVTEISHLLSPKGPIVTEVSELVLSDANKAMLTRYDFERIVNYPYAFVQVANDYSWIAVGQPDLKQFWLLSVKPTMDNEVIEKVLAYQSKVNGYDFSDVVFTDQSCFR